MISNSKNKHILAICESTSGSSIPEESRYLGESDQTSYEPLKVGQNYRVYGLLFISDRIDFLVNPSDQSPFWVPSFLFNLKERNIPSEWEICITNLNDDYQILFKSLKISCIVGYPSLTNDYPHYVGITEGNPDELEIFNRENSIY